MHDDDVEVSFCELCGTSVPVADLRAGNAVLHQGKTVGACCLPALRGAAVPAGAPLVVRPAPANDARVLPVAIVLLAAIAAATVFLEHRLTDADTFHRQSLGQLGDAQTSDSQVLASLAVAMDAVPRRPEFDALAAKVDSLAAASGSVPEALQAQVGAVAREVAALAQQVQAQAAQAVDYRPLLEDLRQRQVRVLDVVSAVRAMAPVAADGPAPPPEPLAPTPADADAGPALPAPLAEQVRKLQAPDPAVRFEAVDELVRSREPAVLAHLVPLARDPDEFVRRLTIEGLRDFKRPEAVDALLAALADEKEWVRDCAWESLMAVTGQKFAFDSGAAKDARARAIQKWQDWWDKNKATFGS